MHQRLAWNPDQPRHSLDIRIASAADGVYVYINNAKPIRLSDISAEDTEVYVRQLSAMLVHYPTPVRINNRPVATEPYRDEPSIRVSKHEGSLLEPKPTYNVVIQGKGYPAILLDQVSYELDTRPAEQNPPNDYYAGALEYHFADRRDGQSHFARLMTYQMLPNYRRDAADLTGWRFQEGYGATPHRCLPPADVMFVLAASQGTPQEYAGVTVIQRHSGGSGPHDALQRVKYPHLPRPRHPQTYATSAWPLPLIAFGQEVNID